MVSVWVGAPAGGVDVWVPMLAFSGRSMARRIQSRCAVSAWACRAGTSPRSAVSACPVLDLDVDIT